MLLFYYKQRLRKGSKFATYTDFILIENVLGAVSIIEKAFNDIGWFRDSG